MRKARNNNNFIDKTFTILADVLLRVFPASQQEKKAFSFYLNGLSLSLSNAPNNPKDIKSIKIEPNT